MRQQRCLTTRLDDIDNPTTVELSPDGRWLVVGVAYGLLANDGKTKVGRFVVYALPSGKRVLSQDTATFTPVKFTHQSRISFQFGDHAQAHWQEIDGGIPVEGPQLYTALSGAKTSPIQKMVDMWLESPKQMCGLLTSKREKSSPPGGRELTLFRRNRS